MKLAPVTKVDKTKKATSKKIDYDIMSKNCDAIGAFRIFSQFGVVRRPDSGCRVCKGYVFGNSNLLPYKNENRTKKSLIQIFFSYRKPNSIIIKIISKLFVILCNSLWMYFYRIDLPNMTPKETFLIIIFDVD